MIMAKYNNETVTMEWKGHRENVMADKKRHRSRFFSSLSGDNKLSFLNNTMVVFEYCAEEDGL